MNIRQCRGNSQLATGSFLHIVPASQAIFLAVGMLVPATTGAALAQAEEREPVSNDDAERLKAERNAKRRAYYRANREHELARAKAYRAANREKAAAQNKAYYAANQEEIRASQAAYREANREKLKASRKAYYAANREKRLADMVAYRNARRAARKQPR
jgi:hypothetical protein